jgi:hypothetical protein
MIEHRLCRLAQPSLCGRAICGPSQERESGRLARLVRTSTRTEAGRFRPRHCAKRRRSSSRRRSSRSTPERLKLPPKVSRRSRRRLRRESSFRSLIDKGRFNRRRSRRSSTCGNIAVSTRSKSSKPPARGRTSKRSSQPPRRLCLVLRKFSRRDGTPEWICPRSNRVRQRSRPRPLIRPPATFSPQAGRRE